MSDKGSLAGEELVMGFDGFGDQSMICQNCYGANFKTLEFSVVCRDCGAEVSNQAMNATLEYKDYHHFKGARVAKDQVMEKSAESPKKLAHLRS